MLKWHQTKESNSPHLRASEHVSFALVLECTARVQVSPNYARLMPIMAPNIHAVGFYISLRYDIDIRIQVFVVFIVPNNQVLSRHPLSRSACSCLIFRSPFFLITNPHWMRWSVVLIRLQIMIKRIYGVRFLCGILQDSCCLNSRRVRFALQRQT